LRKKEPFEKMSSLSNMYVEEFPSPKKDAILLKKRKLYIILAILAVVFVVALFIVYFSAKPSRDELVKMCPNKSPVYSTALVPSAFTPPPFDANKQCSALVCENPVKALGKTLKISTLRDHFKLN